MNAGPSGEVPGRCACRTVVPVTLATVPGRSPVQAAACSMKETIAA
ncbi:hypothetical protein [Streptomyces sp. NPDC096339]